MKYPLYTVNLLRKYGCMVGIGIFCFFTDEDIIKFIERVYPEYLEVFTNLEYKIEQIDFFRYLAVYHYGGLYLDLDMLIESNLDSILDEPTKCKFPIELQNVRDTYLLKQKSSLI